MTNFVYQLSECNLANFPASFAGIAGIYLWTNNANGKKCVGSTIKMNRRLGEYLNPVRLNAELARGESLIYRAMLKYGYSSFSFTVLEVLTFDSDLTPEEKARILEAAEQRYIDELQPEYNLRRIAGSNLGAKMSEATRAKMSAAKKGLPSHRKGKTMSAASRTLSSANSAKAKRVYVYTQDFVPVGSYPSIINCATATGISRFRIARGLDTGKTVDSFIFSTSPIT